VGFGIGRMNTRVIVRSRTPTSVRSFHRAKEAYINGLLDRVRRSIGNAKESIRWRTKKRKARCYNECPAFVAQVQSNFLRRLLEFSLRGPSRPTYIVSLTKNKIGIYGAHLLLNSSPVQVLCPRADVSHSNIHKCTVLHDIQIMQ